MRSLTSSWTRRSPAGRQSLTEPCGAQSFSSRSHAWAECLSWTNRGDGLDATLGAAGTDRVHPVPGVGRVARTGSRIRIVGPADSDGLADPALRSHLRDRCLSLRVVHFGMAGGAIDAVFGASHPSHVSEAVAGHRRHSRVVAEQSRRSLRIRSALAVRVRQLDPYPVDRTS